MQGESAVKCSVVDRLKALRLKRQCTWAELATALGLHPSMLYQVIAQKKNLSDKAIYRLEAEERSAGIPTPGTEAAERSNDRTNAVGAGHPLDAGREARAHYDPAPNVDPYPSLSIAQLEGEYARLIALKRKFEKDEAAAIAGKTESAASLRRLEVAIDYRVRQVEKSKRLKKPT